MKNHQYNDFQNGQQAYVFWVPSCVNYAYGATQITAGYGTGWGEQSKDEDSLKIK